MSEQGQVREYLGNDWDMVVYHNSHEFEPSKYGEERVAKYSELTKIRSVYTEEKMMARYTDFYINKVLL